MAESSGESGACDIMTSKIYEYKDENDWYIGEWIPKYRSGYEFFEVPSKQVELIQRELQSLLEEGSYFSVVTVKYRSPMRFVQFILQMINENQGRNLKAISHKGSILVVKNEQIKKIFLPNSEAVSLTDFFGQTVEEPQTIGDTILIATRNQGKTAEFRTIFEQMGYKVENLTDYPELPEVEETGTTFEENARLKAETISKITGKMVLADDSGLQVDVLGGLPGVWSARFAGSEATDSENNAKLLHELAMVFDMKDRKAHFHTTLVVARPDQESLVVEADWFGYIAYEPKGENGFGYDPLFLVGETGKTSAELTMEEKNMQSHRAQAVKKLVEVFPTWQSKQL